MPRLPAKLISALVSAPIAASGLTILASPQPPIIEVAADQQHVSGAAIDLMRALSQRAGLPFKFAPYPPACGWCCWRAKTKPATSAAWNRPGNSTSARCAAPPWPAG
jgi:hypothetical protein